MTVYLLIVNHYLCLRGGSTSTPNAIVISSFAYL